MYRRSIALLKEKGYHAVDGCFTHPYARTIGERLGFVELGRAYVSQYEDANGVKVFPDAGKKLLINLKIMISKLIYFFQNRKTSSA